MFIKTLLITICLLQAPLYASTSIRKIFKKFIETVDHPDKRTADYTKSVEDITSNNAANNSADPNWEKMTKTLPDKIAKRQKNDLFWNQKHDPSDSQEKKYCHIGEIGENN